MILSLHINRPCLEHKRQTRLYCGRGQATKDQRKGLKAPESQNSDQKVHCDKRRAAETVRKQRRRRL
jgi:hypothetical protein